MDDYPARPEWQVPTTPPQRPATPSAPTLSGPPLSEHNNPSTVYRYTLQMPQNSFQEAVKTLLMVFCLLFMFMAVLDLAALNYLGVRALMVASELSKQLGQ